MERYLVMRGMLVQSGVDDSPALDFPLTSVNGSAISQGDHRIEGTIWRRDDGQAMLTVYSGAWAADYIIGPATADSLAYREGWRRAQRQRVRRAPSVECHGQAHVDGWRAGWQERAEKRAVPLTTA